MKDKIQIEIRQQDWIPGFAAFMGGSLKAIGKAHVVLNVGSLMALVKSKQMKPKEIPYLVAECLMHEVVHVLEEWAGTSFSEKKINELTDKYQEKYGRSPRSKSKSGAVHRPTAKGAPRRKAAAASV
jgi:hypothetical protein